MTELIEHLQAVEEPGSDELFRVEWAYLQLLDRHSQASPVELERRIAASPEFLHELLSLAYRPTGTPPPTKDPSPEEVAKATNAWRLLREWRRTPGTQEDGSLSPEAFDEWLAAVRELADASGRLAVAMITVGEALIHAPVDPDGLWIHRAIAAALDSVDAEEMRRGYSTATHNARGAHFVDPTGAPERALAEGFRTKAEGVERAGYARFASTLQVIADDYDREAESIIARHQTDPEDGV